MPLLGIRWTDGNRTNFNKRFLLPQWWVPKRSRHYGLNYLSIGPVKCHWGKYDWEREDKLRAPVLSWR